MLFRSVDNRTVAEASLNNTRDRDNRSLTFTDSSPRRLEVIVRDSENRTDSDVLFVDPQGPDWDTDDSRDADGSSDGSPTEGSSPGASGPDRQPTIDDSPGCINGVFVEGDAGCIGHISGAGHTDQEEGCEEDFCGVQNPAKETNTSNLLINQDIDNEPGYEFDGHDEVMHSPPRKNTYSSNHRSSHAIGGGDADSGYIAV